MRDMLNNTQVVHLGNLTLSGTTPAVSSWASMAGFQAATIVVVANTITDAGAAAGFTATLQDSATTAASAAASVAAAQAVNGTVTLSETDDDADNTVIGSFGYKGINPYVGVSVTGTSGTDADVSVYAILQKPRHAPPTLIGTAVART